MIFRHPWGDLADPSWAVGADVTVLGVPYDGRLRPRYGRCSTRRQFASQSAYHCFLEEARGGSKRQEVLDQLLALIFEVTPGGSDSTELAADEVPKIKERIIPFRLRGGNA